MGEEGRSAALEELRRQIQELDRDLLRLFCRRQALALQVLEAKGPGAPVRVPEVEAKKMAALPALLADLSQTGDWPASLGREEVLAWLLADSQKFLATLMALSRERQEAQRNVKF